MCDSVETENKFLWHLLPENANSEGVNLKENTACDVIILQISYHSVKKPQECRSIFFFPFPSSLYTDVLSLFKFSSVCQCLLRRKRVKKGYRIHIQAPTVFQSFVICHVKVTLNSVLCLYICWTELSFIFFFIASLGSPPIIFGQDYKDTSIN